MVTEWKILAMLIGTVPNCNLWFIWYWSNKHTPSSSLILLDEFKKPSTRSFSWWGYAKELWQCDGSPDAIDVIGDLWVDAFSTMEEWCQAWKWTWSWGRWDMHWHCQACRRSQWWGIPLVAMLEGLCSVEGNHTERQPTWTILCIQMFWRTWLGTFDISELTGPFPPNLPNIVWTSFLVFGFRRWTLSSLSLFN